MLCSGLRRANSRLRYRWCESDNGRPSAAIREASLQLNFAITCHGAILSAAYAGKIDPVISATLNTRAIPLRVDISLSPRLDVSLLLFDGVLEDSKPTATYTVSKMAAFRCRALIRPDKRIALSQRFYRRLPEAGDDPYL
jgi:hypothetical protein